MLYALSVAFSMLAGSVMGQGGGSYLTPPNMPFFNDEGTYSEAVQSASVLGCGEPNEVAGDTAGHFREYFQIDIGSSAGDVISMTTCNYSQFDTGLSIWEWDHVNDDWWEADLVPIATNDEAPGCLGGSSLSFLTSNIQNGRCYYAMVGSGNVGFPAQTGIFNLKMNCGSGSNSYTLDCPTHSPTQSPTNNPTTSAPTESPTTRSPTTDSPTTGAPTPSPTTDSPTTDSPTTPAPVDGTDAPTHQNDFDVCCVTRRRSYQSQCEAAWQDESACAAVGDRRCTWITDGDLCDQCCLPRRYWAMNAYACAQQSTASGCAAYGQCTWSGLPHCN